MSRKHIPEVTVQRSSRASHVPADLQFRRWVAAALAGSDHGWSVSIRVVGRTVARDLNGRYRGRDRATNVLSFRSELPAGVAAAIEKDSGTRPLGDLVICAPVVKAEAARQGKKVRDHWAHMVVHGALHLLGYDHDQADQARRMEGLEVDILAGLGVPDPYLVGPGKS